MLQIYEINMCVLISQEGDNVLIYLTLVRKEFINLLSFSVDYAKGKKGKQSLALK